MRIGNPHGISDVAVQCRWPAREFGRETRYAPVAQLDRVSASGAEGHRFESCRARQSVLLEEALAEYVGLTGECEGRNEQAIATDVERELTSTLGEVAEDIRRNHQRVQVDYDRETRHSMDREAQRQWT